MFGLLFGTVCLIGLVVVVDDADSNHEISSSKTGAQSESSH
jgi:hypothetical protein